MAYRVEDLKSGQVILELPDGQAPWTQRLLDWAIMKSSGPFAHALMVGNGELIEQLAHCQTSPLDKYVQTGWVYTIAGLTPDKAQGMIAWAKARIGEPYGYWAILQDGLMLDGKDWDMLHVDPKYPTCSGFVERAARIGGGISLTEMPLPSPTALAFSPLLIGPRPWSVHA